MKLAKKNVELARVLISLKTLTQEVEKFQADAPRVLQELHGKMLVAGEKADDQETLVTDALVSVSFRDAAGEQQCQDHSDGHETQ